MSSHQKLQASISTIPKKFLFFGTLITLNLEDEILLRAGRGESVTSRNFDGMLNCQKCEFSKTFCVLVLIARKLKNFCYLSQHSYNLKPNKYKDHIGRVIYLDFIWSYLIYLV